MARDLIPPPSPAGRPDLEGTQTHRFVELPPEPIVDASPPKIEKPLPLPPTVFRNRFGFLAGALGGVVLASIVLAVVFFAWNDNGGDDYDMAPNWSTWKPVDETLADGATEIAKHVQAGYTHPNGDQLVKISLLQAKDLPITLQAGAISDVGGETVVYDMNGLDDGGSLPGEASAERGAVVFREALELSLYTFRYLPDAEGVMVLIPPPPQDPAVAAQNTAVLQAAANGDAAAAAKVPAIEKQQEARQRAIFFRAGDLKSELQVPLGATLPAAAPNEETITSAQVEDINQRVRSNRFLWSEVQGTGVVLKPLPTTP